MSEGRVVKTGKCLKVMVLRERERERVFAVVIVTRKYLVPVGIASKKIPESCSSGRETEREPV